MRNYGQIPRSSDSRRTLFPTDELRESGQTPATAKTNQSTASANLFIIFCFALVSYYFLCCIAVLMTK